MNSIKKFMDLIENADNGTIPQFLKNIIDEFKYSGSIKPYELDQDIQVITFQTVRDEFAKLHYRHDGTWKVIVGNEVVIDSEKSNDPYEELHYLIWRDRS